MGRLPTNWRPWSRQRGPQLVSRMKQTPEGRAALAAVARRHGDVLLPSAVRNELLAATDRIRATLAALDAGPGVVHPGTDPGQAPPAPADKPRTLAGQPADTKAR